LLAQHRGQVGFGIATGRHFDSAVRILKKHKVPTPDIMICSVGSEIYYGSRGRYGQEWATHISHRWDREKIVDILKGLDFLTYQEPEAQRAFKVSYYMAPGKDRLPKIHDLLLR